MCPQPRIPPPMLVDAQGRRLGTLCCLRCGKSTELSEEEAGRYLRHGWPSCCGLTVLLVEPAVRQEQ